MFTTSDPKRLLYQFRDDCNHMLLPAMRDFAKPWWKSNYGPLSKIRKGDLCKHIHDHLNAQIPKTPKEVITIESSSDSEDIIVTPPKRLIPKPLAIPEKLDSFEAPLQPASQVQFDLSPKKSTPKKNKEITSKRSPIKLYSPLKSITEQELALVKKQNALELESYEKEQAIQRKKNQQEHEELNKYLDEWWYTLEEDYDIFE